MMHDASFVLRARCNQTSRLLTSIATLNNSFTDLQLSSVSAAFLLRDTRSVPLHLQAPAHNSIDKQSRITETDEISDSNDVSEETETRREAATPKD